MADFIPQKYQLLMQPEIDIILTEIGLRIQIYLLKNCKEWGGENLFMRKIQKVH